MKKKYDIDKLKKVEVDVLDKFVSICEQNKIDYFLAYGTLLGAVRHKGFIPWDDDIDVYLSPEDYYRFKDIMKSNPVDGYFYQSLETEKFYSLPFAKLRKNNTKVVEKKFENENMHMGIYVDIFPLLPYPKDESDQKRLYKNLKVINLLIQSDLKDNPNYKTYGRLGKILTKFMKIVPRKLRNKIAEKKLKDMILYNKEYDQYICIMDRIKYQKSNFNNSILLSFEGKKYRAPKEYDKYLTSMYGDYMTPPKKEDRATHSFIEVKFEDEK